MTVVVVIAGTACGNGAASARLAAFGGAPMPPSFTLLPARLREGERDRPS